MIPRLVLAAFLVAHALIHTGFVSARPAQPAGGPVWPFDLGRSWLLGPVGVGEGPLRALGVGLLVVLVLAYVAAALASVGLLPLDAFAPGIGIGSAASLALLVLFFHPWLVLGIAIDVALLWAALVADWGPEGLGS